jgi:prepilin-type processing-associated H-X9-DG protein
MGNITMLTFDYPTAMTENGVIYMNSNISVGKITDGSSHTLLVGECTLSGLTPSHNGAIWAGMHGSVDISIAVGQETVLISDAMWWINSDPNWCVNGIGPQAFGSNHPGGASFCFADGSIHFLRTEIDGTTLENLAARNDGMLVGNYD